MSKIEERIKQLEGYIANSPDKDPRDAYEINAWRKEIEQLRTAEMTHIKPERLRELGFIEVEDEKDSLDRPIYRIKPPREYPFDIQLVMGDYPNTNPNCGVVSIHSAASVASAVPEDLYDKDEWTEEDVKRAENYTIDLEAWTQPIAWYVHTEERLLSIIKSLIGEKSFADLFLFKL
jgi:hypothetical protein